MSDDTETPEAELARRILAVHGALLARVKRIKTEAAHVPLDHLRAAWDGLLRPHDAQDLRRWRRYVERAERLTGEEAKRMKA